MAEMAQVAWILSHRNARLSQNLTILAEFFSNR
ncbi:MAG: hypothetical protein ACI9P3_000666 [Bradyrhizobium sp.]|jgi:hypothetical protein